MEYARMLPYLFLFFAALIASLILTPAARKMALRLNILDHPDEERKAHSEPMSLLGGIAIYLAFLFATGLTLKFGFFYELANLSLQIKGILWGSVIIVALGLWDDTKGSSAGIKFAGQILAAFIIYQCGIGFERITFPFGKNSIELGALSFMATAFWVCLLCNAINLTDGMDGLAGGTVAIASIFLFIIGFKQQHYLTSLFAVILAGSCLGFLKYNFPPARIYMGDTGSMFLGFILAAISLVGSRKTTVGITLLAPIILVLIPLFDTFWAIIRRWIGKKPIFQGDNHHFHHRLGGLGFPKKTIVLGYYLFSSLLGIAACWASGLQKEQAFSFFLLLLLILGFFLVILRVMEKRMINGTR